MLSLAQRKLLTEKVEAMHLALRGENPASNYLRSRGISGRTAQQYRLGYCTEGPFADRLAVPYLTEDGDVLDVKYRRINDRSGVAKYLHETGAGTSLFNAYALLQAREVAVLCEGEIDAITVTQALNIPAVAYPGTEQWQTYWRLCFDGIDDVIVAADADDNGQGGRAADRRAGLIPYARVARMPSGYDVNLLYVDRGATALADALGVTLEEPDAEAVAE